MRNHGRIVRSGKNSEWLRFTRAPGTDAAQSDDFWPGIFSQRNIGKRIQCWWSVGTSNLVRQFRCEIAFQACSIICRQSEIIGRALRQPRELIRSDSAYFLTACPHEMTRMTLKSGVLRMNKSNVGCMGFASH